MNKNKLFILDFLRKNYHSNHRSVIFLCGSHSWSYKVATHFLSLFSKSSKKCWFGNINASYLKNISNLEIINLLNKQKIIGTEIDLMVIDGWSGLSPNLLGLASGTLKGGSVLLILLPDIVNLISFKDPFLENFKSKRPYQYEMHNNFLKRLFHKISLDKINENAFRVIYEKNKLEIKNELILFSKFYESERNQIDKNKNFIPNIDQNNIIESMRNLYNSNNGIVYINADRGRGKTVSLALGVCGLLKDSKKNIIITAPNRLNVKNFFDVLDRESYKINFFPVDKLISQYESCQNNFIENGILIVDEAAAFPLSILKKLTKIFKKIIFSTTVEGYEGSGRGFAINFKRTLSEIDPLFRSLSLSLPLRWSNLDPVEDFFKDLLIMSDEKFISNPSINFKIQNMEIHLIDQYTLSINEPLLIKIYSLLVSSHYQTRPDDLRMILDAPYLRLWIATIGDFSEYNIIGVLLATEEGGFNNTQDGLYLDQIVKNQRRPRGNLLTQLMTSHSGDQTWSKLSSLRIMRIAVHMKYRKRGIATLLLNALEFYAISKHYSFLSVTFGFSSDIYDFWEKKKMRMINIGMHIDKSSGSRNIMLAKSLDQFSKKLIKSQARTINNNIIFYKKNYFSEFSVEEWNKIYSASYDEQINIKEDIRLINRFIKNELSFENTFPSICRFYKKINENESQLYKKLIIVKSTIDYAPRWSIIAEENHLSGRKSIIDKIKNELMSITHLISF